MSDYSYRTLALYTATGVWHRGMLDEQTGTLLTPEACNLDQAKESGDIEQYPDLPEWAKGTDLCKRCYATESDR